MSAGAAPFSGQRPATLAEGCKYLVACVITLPGMRLLKPAGRQLSFQRNALRVLSLLCDPALWKCARMVVRRGVWLTVAVKLLRCKTKAQASLPASNVTANRMTQSRPYPRAEKVTSSQSASPRVRAILSKPQKKKTKKKKDGGGGTLSFY